MKQIKLPDGVVKVVEDAYVLEEGEVEIEEVIPSQNLGDPSDEQTPPEEKEKEEE